MANQRYKDFEAIVAEDGESVAINECVSKAKENYSFEVLHTIQEDIGVRKSKSQNNAIRASNGEYLIFIDGDYLLYSKFIDNHVALSGENNIITGRRANVGPEYSKKLSSREINSLWLEKNFIYKYFDIKEDAKTEHHSEEGFSIKPNGFVHSLIRSLRKKEFPILGCNMSFYKNVMLQINSFDEELGNSAMASDTDLAWCFKGLGYKIVSARYMANEFHLYHKHSSDEYDRAVDIQMIENKKNKIFRCLNGIEKF